MVIDPRNSMVCASCGQTFAWWELAVCGWCHAYDLGISVAGTADEVVAQLAAAGVTPQRAWEPEL